MSFYPYKKLDIDKHDDAETKLIKTIHNCASFCAENPGRLNSLRKYAWVFFVYQLFSLDIITDKKTVDSFVKCVYPEYWEYLERCENGECAKKI